MSVYQPIDAHPSPAGRMRENHTGDYKEIDGSEHAQKMHKLHEVIGRALQVLSYEHSSPLFLIFVGLWLLSRCLIILTC